jgi:hypothetical protein
VRMAAPRHHLGDGLQTVRLHPRLQIVTAAGRDLSDAVDRVCREHQLTDVEALRLLHEQSGRFTTWLLRAERHPDDPDRKADEL